MEYLNRITCDSGDIKEGVIWSNGGGGGGGCGSSGGGYVGDSWSGGGGRSGGTYCGNTRSGLVAVRWLWFIVVVVAAKDDLQWILSVSTTSISLIVKNLFMFMTVVYRWDGDMRGSHCCTKRVE